MRRDTTNRFTLFRTCPCGRNIKTTADSPWMRRMPRDGKKQATTYFCSSKCFKASYKHPSCYDGKTAERKRAYQVQRDIREKNLRYYWSHAEQMRQRRREAYWVDPEADRENSRYYRRKNKLMEASA